MKKYRIVPGWQSMIPRPIIIPRSPHTTNHQSWHVLHTNYHAMKSLHFYRCSFLLSLTFRFQSSCLSIEYQSTKSLLLHSHEANHTHEKRHQASNSWSKLHLCLFLCVKSFLFLFLCFLWSPFPLLFLYFYVLFLSWSSNGQSLFAFALSFEVPFLCPWAQVLNPKKSRCACSWSTAPKYWSRVFLICSYVLIVAAFDRRCCWSAPEVLCIKVATSTLSGIGVPVCCSYLAFIVSQALKSCSKVCALNFRSSILVRSDTWRVESGSEKTLAQSTPSFKAISCCILANQKSSRSCTQVG